MNPLNLKPVPDQSSQPSQNDPTHITISVQTANKVITYLATQPFKDVFELLPEFAAECNKSFLEQKGE